MLVKKVDNNTIYHKIIYNKNKYNKMLSVLRNLYNNGENTGDINIKLNDKTINAHSFVLFNTSEYFRIQMNSEDFNKNTLIEVPIQNDIITITPNKTIEIQCQYEIINIILNYLYSEKVIEKELSPTDIIELFSMIHTLQCHNSIIKLKNYYLLRFPKLLTPENWLELLEYVFNVNKFSELQDEILLYYKNIILNNTETINITEITETYRHINGEIKNVLFSITIMKINTLVYNMKNDNCNNNSIQTKRNLNKFLLKTDIDENEYDDEEENEYEEEIEKEEIVKVSSSKIPKKTVRRNVK